MASLTITLNDGNTIPWLGYGTGTALYKQEVKKEVLLAISTGITHLDGAQVYGNEASIGDAIAESGLPRSKFYVTTKLSQVPAGQTVRDTIVESLRKLKLDYVDQFLVHTPKDHANLKAVWKEVEELQKEGLAKSIGVSNFQVKHLEEILDGASVIPAVNQVCATSVPAERKLTAECCGSWSTTPTFSRRQSLSSSCRRSTTLLLPRSVDFPPFPASLVDR